MTSSHKFKEALIDMYSKPGVFIMLNRKVTISGLVATTLISLVNVEVGINVEGVQKLPNH